MATIGTFTAGKDGYAGTIRTLTISVKARIVANEAKKSDAPPDFQVYAGRAELGAAWKQRTSGDMPRDYLSVQLDDPSFAEPISGRSRIVWTLMSKRQLRQCHERLACRSARPAGLPDDFKTILEGAKNMLASVPAWVLPAGLTAFAILFTAVGLERLTASNPEGKTLWQTLTARARGTRAGCREALEQSQGYAILSQKHADLFAPVADDERALAVEIFVSHPVPWTQVCLMRRA